jgi:hypothetical protein
MEYQFSHKELATLLVKHQQLHEGIWAVSYNFGLSATNMGPSPTEVMPTAMLHLVSVALRKVERISSVSVDAAEVNPVPAG